MFNLIYLGINPRAHKDLRTSNVKDLHMNAAGQLCSLEFVCLKKR